MSDEYSLLFPDFVLNDNASIITYVADFILYLDKQNSPDSNPDFNNKFSGNLSKKFSYGPLEILIVKDGISERSSFTLKFILDSTTKMDNLFHETKVKMEQLQFIYNFSINSGNR